MTQTITKGIKALADGAVESESYRSMSYLPYGLYFD